MNKKEETSSRVRLEYIWYIWLFVIIMQQCIAFPFRAQGNSMHPTIHNKTVLIVEKVSGRRTKITNKQTIARNDIILFYVPKIDTYYVKRVIGLPGEKVIITNNQIQACTWDTCTTLKQKYLSGNVVTSTDCGIDTFYAGSGYIALWDNREHSTDSRCCFVGTCEQWDSYVVEQSAIMGRIWRMFELPWKFRLFSKSK